MPTVSSFAAATKSWVAARLAEKANLADAVSLAGSGNLPRSAGTAFQGSANIAARSDHVHPLQPTQGYPLPAVTDDNYLPNLLPLGRVATWNEVANIQAPLTPFPVYRPMAIKEMGLWLASGADAGNAKLAMFASDATGMPAGLPFWLSAAKADTGGTGTQLSWTGLDIQVPSIGKYWLCFVSYGWSATRAVPCRPSSAIIAETMMATNPNSATYAPTMQITGVNTSTGAIPATPVVGFANDGSAFAYYIRAKAI